MRQVQVLHEPDEVAFIGPAADARVVRPLLRHRRHGAATVVVRRKEKARIGQREDLPDDRAIKDVCTAVLEVAATGAADQQRVAGEGQTLVVEHQRHAAVGVARRGAHLQVAAAERDAIAVIERQVDTLDRRLVAPRDRNAAAGGLLHHPGAGDVVGMAVRIHRDDELEVQLAEQRGVAQVLLKHRVNEYCMAGARVAQYIRIRRRGGVEQLAENEVGEHGDARSTRLP